MSLACAASKGIDARRREDWQQSAPLEVGHGRCRPCGSARTGRAPAAGSAPALGGYQYVTQSAIRVLPCSSYLPNFSLGNPGEVRRLPHHHQRQGCAFLLSLNSLSAPANRARPKAYRFHPTATLTSFGNIPETI